DPVAHGELGGVRAARTHPADGAGAGNDRRREEIAALAAEDVARVGEHVGGGDVDDNLTGAEDRIREFSNDEGGAQPFEHCCFHVPILAPARRLIQAWYYPGTGSPPLADAKRNELGDFLRSRRERLTPAAVGLPAGRRRRTPGLRREEVADLAGIGVDWYLRL